MPSFRSSRDSCLSLFQRFQQLIFSSLGGGGPIMELTAAAEAGADDKA